jgi:hypothetical protein
MCLHSYAETTSSLNIFENSKCKVSMKKSFMAEGWAALHQAVLNAGAEFDYWPPDYPELKNRSYIDGAQYAALLAPLLYLTNVDTEALGLRSTAVKKAVWRWIRRSGKANAPLLWGTLVCIKSRSALLAEFGAFNTSRQLAGIPCSVSRNPVALVRFGFRLITEGKMRGEHPIVPILWGLAIIGAVWGERLKCGYCKLCFRRSRPGKPYCSFHTQRGATKKKRSAAYLCYRRGRLAKSLAENRGNEANLTIDMMLRYSNMRLTLSNVLFPMKPCDGWESEREMLVYSLERSPRVVKEARLSGFYNMPYKKIIRHLRKYIDPDEWSDETWEWRVSQAEIWFSLEGEVSPGKRGRGRKTAMLVQEAIRLASAGMRKGEIAIRLGVSASTISTWMKRYQEFGRLFTSGEK